MTGGSRTALARQQALRASVGRSVDLLDETDQVVRRNPDVPASCHLMWHGHDRCQAVMARAAESVWHACGTNPLDE